MSISRDVFFIFCFGHLKFGSNCKTENTNILKIDSIEYFAKCRFLTRKVSVDISPKMPTGELSVKRKKKNLPWRQAVMT